MANYPSYAMQSAESAETEARLRARHAQAAQRGGHTATPATPATPVSQPKQEQTESRTYELNTGSKTYTLSQQQIDGVRQLHVNSWADAYSFDDEDQQRKAAGVAPRSYAQSYTDTKLDNWLYENKLPSMKYLDKYLEAYSEYEAEQKEYQNKATAKTNLYQNAARVSVELELQGIYNDNKLYDWNGEQRTGRYIHTNAFFDLLSSGDYSGLYVYDKSATDKTEVDFDTTAKWREYQMQQASKAFDRQDDWDEATSISYNDYVNNYSANYIRQIKAQKVVDDAFSGTIGDAITHNEDIRNREAYAALTTDAAVDEFVANNQDDPAAVIVEMYAYGVDEAKIGRAKNQFVKEADTEEDKEAILAAFSSGKQARKDAERKTREQQQAALTGVRDIFNKTVKYDGGGADADSLTQAVEAAREAGYSAEDIASVATDLRRELAQGGMLGFAADGVLAGAIHPEREANAAADEVIRSVQESYTRSATELSPVTAEQVANIILSNLEYQGNRVTDESVQAGMEAAIASGASYSVLREAADAALSQLERARTVDNGGSRVPGAYTGDFTTREIMDNALASAKKEDETLLAAATRKALEDKGYTAFEIDQAFRRNGWSGRLNAEEEARDYFIEVALPREMEADPDGWREALGDLTPEQYATLYWDNMTDAERTEYVAAFKESSGYNTDLHRTHGEQAIAQFAMIVPRVLTGIASGVVNLADMAEGMVSGRTDRWDVSKTLSGANTFTQNLGRSAGQDAASDFIAGANDVATELLRMYALNAAGTGLAKVFSGMGTATVAVPGATTAGAAVAGASSKGLGKVLDIAKRMFSAQSAPFLATAMGGYYAEAMESGATRQQATLYGLVAGTIEGALEAVNVDSWINNRLGGKRFLNQVQASGRNALRQGYTKGIKLIGLASSALGEGLEEGASYLASTFMRSVTFDPNAKLSGAEMLNQMGMGALIGVLGAGASMAGDRNAYTETGILYNYLSENVYNANVADALLTSVQYDLMDEFARATAEKNANILSIEDYRSHMTTIEQAGKAMDTADANLRSAIENATADVEARRAAVTQLKEQLAAADLTTEEGRAKAAKLSQELTAAKGRLANAIATSDSAVQKARDARSHTYTQNQRATEKARAALDAHFVAMRNLLLPQIREMEAAGSMDAETRRAFEAQFADVMASIRAGVMPTAAEETAWDAYAAESKQAAAGDDDPTGSVLSVTDALLAYRDHRTPQTESDLRNAVSSTPLEQIIAMPEVQTAYDRSEYTPEQETININTAERQAKREEWGNRLSSMGSYSGQETVDGKEQDVYNGDVKNERIAFIIIGQSSAGKSTIANPISQQYSARIYDSDVVKAMIDEFDGGYGAGRVHIESATIADDALYSALENGTNIVLPIVGKTYQRVADYAADMKKHGYTVNLVLNELDAEKAAKRAVTRFFTTGRFVDPSYVAAQGDKPVETYKKALEEGIADGYQWFNNDVEYGQPPKLIHQQGTAGVLGSVSQDVYGNDGQSGRNAASESSRATESESGETSITAPDLGANTATFETTSAEAQTEALDLGNKLGVSVVFVDMPDGISGEYADGEIRINKRQPVGENAAKVVLRHELTHYIEGSDAYTEFSDFVVRLAQRLNPDMNINAVYQGLIDDYAARGKTLDEQGARKEFVAYFVQSELLQNERSIQMLVNEKSGIAGRVLNWIRYQIDKLKLRGSNNAVARELLEAERLYTKAFSKASRKSYPQTKESLDSQYAIVRDKQYGYRVIADNGVYPTRDSDGNIKASDEYLPIIKDIVKGIRGKSFVSLLDGETLSVAQKNKVAQKLYRPGLEMDPNKYSNRLAAVSVYDEVIAASKSEVEPYALKRDHATFKADSLGNRSVVVEIPIFDSDGKLESSKVYRVGLVVVGNETGNIAYDINRINEIKDSHSDLYALKKQGFDIDRESIAGIIRENLDVVNTENAGQNSFSNSTWQQMIDRYGKKSAGMEPRARDEAVPERASDTQRVSDFLRSFVESDKATAAMVDEVRLAVEAGDFGVYTEQSNRLTQSLAQSAISRKGQIKAAEDFHADVAANHIKAETIATGLQLLAEASQRGDADTTLSLLADLCICSTETGRALQVFSMLKKMGGVGSAYYMERLEERLNRKYEKEIASGKMLPIKIDGTLMRNLAEAKTANEIEAAEAAIAVNLGQQLPLTLQQKMSNWRYFSMLANPTTHIRNMTGNALMSGIRGAKDVVATGIERAFVRNSADRTHAIYSKAHQADRVAYAEQSFETNKRDLTTGGKYGFETFMKQNQRLFDNKLLNKAAQLNFQALEGEDAIFLKTAYRDAMVQYMVAQDLDPTTMSKADEAKAVAWASDQAWKATFRDASQVATLLNRVSNLNTAAKVIVEGVMPFKKTPINIAKRGIEYSPIGLIQGVYQLKAGVKSGKYTVAQGIDRLASGITGTGLVALGALLGSLGVLRGQGEEEEKYETFLQSTGEQAYSLNIGDVSIGISGLAPATIPLFMGVSLFESINREEAFDMSALVDVLASTADPLMEMSFMSSLNAALESYNQDGVGGALGQVAWNAASSYVSQHIPTFTGKVGQFLDPYTRTSKADSSSVLGGTLDSFLRSTLKKIPGASSAVLEPYVDVSGEAQQKTAFSEWATDFLNKFVSPGTIKVKDRNRVDEELIRLVESTGETDFLPSYGRKYFTVDGERYDMSASQYTDYSVARGEACYAAVKKIIQTSAYKNASDEQKSKMLSKAVQNVVDVVNDQYKEKLGVYDD